MSTSLHFLPSRSQGSLRTTAEVLHQVLLALLHVDVDVCLVAQLETLCVRIPIIFLSLLLIGIFGKGKLLHELHPRCLLSSFLIKELVQRSI